MSNHALDWTPADKRAVDLVRVLAMDAVQKVGNGHPGTAMSLAPAAYLLYQRVMRHDPADPKWPGRDRFVLSCGHSSLTLYIQHDSPGKAKESNWLPAPDGPIYLAMRLYWPKQTPPSILPAGEGTWKPPGIVATAK